MYRTGKSTQYMYLPNNTYKSQQVQSSLLVLGLTETEKTLNFIAISIYGNQREGMGQLEYHAMPSLRNVAHDGALFTFSNRSVPDRGRRHGPSITYKITPCGVTLLASQAGRRVGPAIYSLRPHCMRLKMGESLCAYTTKRRDTGL